MANTHALRPQWTVSNSDDLGPRPGNNALTMQSTVSMFRQVFSFTDRIGGGGSGPAPAPPASCAFTEVGCFVDSEIDRVLSLQAQLEGNSDMTAKVSASS